MLPREWRELSRSNGFSLWEEWAFLKEWSEVLREWSLETCLGGFKGPLGEFESSLRQHSPQWGGFK